MQKDLATTRFTERKQAHLDLALDESNQAHDQSGLDTIDLIHDSLPDLNLNEIEIKNPFFISGMTAGHENAILINVRLAQLASERGWILGVGSQRRELEQEDYQDDSLKNLKKHFPKIELVANFGIAQLITAIEQKKISRLFEITDRMQASFLAIHLNPIQEAIQGEGTPQFKGSLQALQTLIEASSVPVVIKETGSGMSESTLKKIAELKPFAVDVSGLGGTHWGRIEGKRAPEFSIQAELGKTFKNWGISTVNSVKNAKKILPSSVQIWASGGVRTGLDAAKLIALGANKIGYAKPVLEAAMLSEAALRQWMMAREQELRVAMFCTNSKTLSDLNETKLKVKENSHG